MKKLIIAGALLGTMVVANADVLLNQVSQTSIIQNKVKELVVPLTLTLERNASEKGYGTKTAISTIEDAQMSAAGIAAQLKQQGYNVSESDCLNVWVNTKTTAGSLVSIIGSTGSNPDYDDISAGMLSATIAGAIGFLDYNQCVQNPEVGFVAGSLVNGLLIAWIAISPTPPVYSVK